MAAFVSSMIILVLGVAICMYVGARRPLGTPLTWGEAMVGAVYVLVAAAFGTGRMAFPMVAQSYLAGGHVRVGRTAVADL